MNHEGEEDAEFASTTYTHSCYKFGSGSADSERLPCRLENTLFRGDRKRNPSLQEILTLHHLFEVRNGEFTPEVGGGPIAMTPRLLDHKVIPSR